jgi:hypothetical protein
MQRPLVTLSGHYRLSEKRESASQLATKNPIKFPVMHVLFKTHTSRNIVPSPSGCAHRPAVNPVAAIEWVKFSFIANGMKRKARTGSKWASKLEDERAALCLTARFMHILTY